MAPLIAAQPRVAQQLLHSQQPQFNQAAYVLVGSQVFKMSQDTYMLTIVEFEHNVLALCQPRMDCRSLQPLCAAPSSP